MIPAAAAGAVGAVVVAGVAAWGERRRSTRADPDRVGWIDWRTIQVTAIVAALILVSVAANG